MNIKYFHYLLIFLHASVVGIYAVLNKWAFTSDNLVIMILWIIGVFFSITALLAHYRECMKK